MSKREYILTPSEIEILHQGMDDPDYITGYWFRTEDRPNGFIFDFNFDPEGAWQKILHHAQQNTIVMIGGVGSGKTLGVGMSAVAWAMTTESFKFLNVAQKEWQARLMYDLILERAMGAPFEKLIYSFPQRPYPKIVIRYRLGKRIVQSSLEFMSVDKDARGIFSWRGDWINVEEAGLLDNLDEVAKHLSTRLTGSTPAGRPFLGRFSFISNPWDTPHLWLLFDLASGDPENNLSLVISTRHNHNVTDKQIRDMLKHIPQDEHARFLDGLRPEGKGNYFSKECIYACEDTYQAEIVEEAVENGKQGYQLHSAYACGVVNYQSPPIPGRMYFLLGDPGSDNAPARNSPVIQVWDVTNFPTQPMRLIAFWWGAGNGKISPFVDKLLEWRDYYKPFFTGIDSTGTQKSIAELINIQFLETEDQEGISEWGIRGLDFSGPKKAAYLVAARLILEAKLARWPKNIAGMRAQLANYDPAKDHGAISKIPQDIVSCFAMSCFVARSYFNVNFEEIANPPKDDLEQIPLLDGRERRLPVSERARRTSDGRPKRPSGF